MPSVTSALKKLSERELVEHERYGRIKLTPEGGRIARDVIRRHKALTRFLTEALGIDRELAGADACKIEHVISPLSLERMVKFIEFMEACPLGEASFPKRYKYYLEHGQPPEECREKVWGRESERDRKAIFDS